MRAASTHGEVLSSRPVTTNGGLDPVLMDILLECYLDWRETCKEVALTYDDWRAAGSGDRGTAFAAYRCALELEQDASDVYAEMVTAAIDRGDLKDRAGRTIRFTAQLAQASGARLG